MAREAGGNKTIEETQWTVNGRGGWTVGETATHWIDIFPMIFNDRVCLTPKHDPSGYDYGWCYDRGGAALYAAAVWDPDTQAEPAGFKKRVGDRVRTL